MRTLRLNRRQKTRWRGITTIEFTVTVAILAVLAAIYLAYFSRPPHRGPHCVNNLKQVGLAFRQWALDNDGRFPMQVSVTNGGTMELIGDGSVFVHFLVMSNELNTPKVLFCPKDTDLNRVMATAFVSTGPDDPSYRVPLTNDHSVSYFVGLDAVETSPQMFLTGDDNLEIHGFRVKQEILSLWTNTTVTWTKDRHVNQGNVGFADGSVQAFNSQALTQASQSSGVATNRLAIP